MTGIASLFTRHPFGARPPTAAGPMCFSRVPEPYAGAGVVQLESDAGPIWLEASDEVMVPYLRTNGTWEADEGRLLRMLVKPGDVFVDVGANVGYFVRLVARECSPSAIHAFEPQRTSVSLLRLNAWDLPVPVTVWPLALGDTQGTVVVSTSEHNVGDTRVNTPGTGAHAVSTAVSAVARMDELISGRVDVVKVDVQGFETEVLRGMTRIASQNPGIALIVEFWPGALRSRGVAPVSVLDQYRAAGYTIDLMREAGPIAADSSEILQFCDSAGRDGQANLLLRRR